MRINPTNACWNRSYRSWDRGFCVPAASPTQAARGLSILASSKPPLTPGRPSRCHRCWAGWCLSGGSLWSSSELEIVLAACEVACMVNVVAKATVDRFARTWLEGIDVVSLLLILGIVASRFGWASVIRGRI